MSEKRKSEPQSDMGKRISERMTELGLNAKQLSLAAGLNETYVRDLLKTEKPNPRFYHLKALAGQLGVSMHWLDTGEEVEPESKPKAEVVDIWSRILDAKPARQSTRQPDYGESNNLKRGDNIA